jgi:hypothetical protein
MAPSRDERTIMTVPRKRKKFLVSLVCNHCQQLFLRPQVSRTISRLHHYCTEDCRAAARRHLVTLTCYQCQTTFPRLPGEARKYEKPFCTMTCWQLYRQDFYVRFWERVDIRSFRECWPWLASRTAPQGYGHVSKGERTVHANKVAFEFMWGPLPPHHLALHRCDHRPCCNPWHLFAGTPMDNMVDKIQKGRGVLPPVLYGAKNPNTKLSTADVQTIRYLYEHGSWSRQRLADRFDVAYQTIDAIVKGRARIHD